MATAINGARPPKFVPAINIPQIIAFATMPGRLVSSEYGPTEVVFDLTDGRPWYVPQVIADEIYAAGIAARQQIEVTGLGRKKTDVRIVPVQQRLQGNRDYTPELEASLAQQNARRAAPSPEFAAPSQPAKVQPNGSAPAAPPQGANAKTSAATACMMAAMCSAVDAIIETQAYATRKGIGLTFSEESVRAIGLSIYIHACRNGGAW